MKITLEGSPEEILAYMKKEPCGNKALAYYCDQIGLILRQQYTPHDTVIIDSGSYRITADVEGAPIKPIEW